MKKLLLNNFWWIPSVGLCLQSGFVFSENLELPIVNITAQKHTQSLLDTPIAITVIDQEVIDQRHAKTLSEIQTFTPGFSVIQNGLTKSISIRGIGGGGRNIGFGTRAGVYIDGVYIGQSPALESPVFDIEQIEILKGPQGFLFGRNSDAGAVSITTQPPSEVLSGYLRSGYGNYNYFENTLNVSGPIREDLLAKLIVNTETRDGFIQNSFNRDDLKNLKRFSTRSQLRYFATDQLTLDVSFDYANIHQTDFLPQAVTGLFDAPISQMSKHRVNVNNQTYAKNEIFGGALKAEYDLQAGHRVTSISALRRTKSLQQVDNDYSSVDLIHTNFADDFLQLSQELRIASPHNQKVRYVLGMYAEHEAAKTDRVATFGEDVATLVQLPGVASAIPFNAAFGILPNSKVPHQGRIKTEVIALFGSLDLDITPALTLNLGGRYNSEYKHLQYSSDGLQSGALNLATLNDYRDHLHAEFFSPMAGLSYALSPQIKTYAKYSRGFKSGGWNVDFLNTAQINDGFKFDQETVDSIEAGLKAETTNRHWQFDLSIFKQRYHDFQVFQFADLGTGQTVLQLRNAAKAQTQGLEANFKGLIKENWRLSGGVALLDARFLSFANGSANGDAAGQRLPDAPALSARLSADYTLNAPSLNGKLNFFIEEAYQSKTYSGFSSDQNVSELESRHLVNAQIRYFSNNKHWEFGLWARNLLDKHYTKTSGRDFFRNQIVFYGDPRMFGVTGQYNF